MSTEEIRPFRIDVPPAGLDDLARRLQHTRWPDPAPADEWSHGIPLDYTRELAEYWRAQEARLNTFPQFRTEIDGQQIHFLHVRSAAPHAVALVLTHGWPGSFVEFLDMIGPLTEPDDPADAFDVVVPTLPGFGFCGPTREAGWTVPRIARAWAELMRRLGYDRYVAHGGDWGAAVSRELGLADPEHVRAIHLTQLFGAAATADLSDEAERRSVEAGYRFEYELSGYAAVQNTRPQSLAYALTDSPVGQLAWIVDLFGTAGSSARGDGPPEPTPRAALFERRCTTPEN